MLNGSYLEIGGVIHTHSCMQVFTVKWRLMFCIPTVIFVLLIYFRSADCSQHTPLHKKFILYISIK